ncbi:anti-sigma factor domain-containing protein [Zunongwangia sp.]|uniref:anti-sigma factor n=1 Tax=Zunongwangia sp. TaxID=1965325 RepID=UPI003AA84437
MATQDNYLTSGILELYVYGALSEKENIEITAMLKKHPEIQKEVSQIEDALQQLASGVAPNNPEHLLNTLKQKLNLEDSEPSNTATRNLPRQEAVKWSTYLGWAASFVFLIGLFFLFRQNHNLRQELVQSKLKNSQIEQQLVDLREQTNKNEQVLAAIRDRNISRIPLEGQKAAPNSYAVIYWNTEENTTYIDAKGLPEPPPGKIYQVWSLKMQPLTPTSLGLLADFQNNDNKIFYLQNTNASEGFGITLEPEGGSKTPTMDQLYVLGTT